MSNNENGIYSLLVSCWGIRNSALQSARTIFIAVEAIFLSIVTVLALSEEWFKIALFLVPLGIILVEVWKKVCEDCGLDDLYFRWKILKLEEGQGVSKQVFTGFMDWRDKDVDSKREELCNDTLGKYLWEHRSRMRIWLDNRLPWIFMFHWIFLIVFVILRSFEIWR
jgi:hypothetical protein